MPHQVSCNKSFSKLRDTKTKDISCIFLFSLGSQNRLLILIFFFISQIFFVVN